MLDEYRGPVPSILAAAAGVEASLIVMGRRPGAHDGSVSAEVAGAATCSVLVVAARARSARGPEPRGGAPDGDAAADGRAEPGL